MTDREAMKMALEAMEWHVSRTRPIEKTTEAMDALRQALAQTEQEPVAWMYVNEDGEVGGIEYGVPTVKAPYIKLLYTAPPSKPWVSLTHDERVQAFVDAGLELAYMDYEADMKITSAIEAALKEKNT